MALLSILVIALIAAVVVIRWGKARQTLLQFYQRSRDPGDRERNDPPPLGEKVVLSPYAAGDSTHGEQDHEETLNALAAHGMQLDDLEFDEDPLGGSWATTLRSTMETQFPSFDAVDTNVDEEGLNSGGPGYRVPSRLQGAAQRLELVAPLVREVDDQPRAPERLELQFGRMEATGAHFEYPAAAVDYDASANRPAKIKLVESEV